MPELISPTLVSAKCQGRVRVMSGNTVWPGALSESVQEVSQGGHRHPFMTSVDLAMQEAAFAEERAARVAAAAAAAQLTADMGAQAAAAAAASQSAAAEADAAAAAAVARVAALEGEVKALEERAAHAEAQLAVARAESEAKLREHFEAARWGPWTARKSQSHLFSPF